MNALQIVLDEIKRSSTKDSIPTKEFIIDVKGKANPKQLNKILEYAKELDLLSKSNMSDEDIIAYSERFDEILSELKKMKIRNPKTMNRLIVIALDTCKLGRKKEYSKYTRNLLNLLYNMDKEAFLSNFIKK